MADRQPASRFSLQTAVLDRHDQVGWVHALLEPVFRARRTRCHEDHFSSFQHETQGGEKRKPTSYYNNYNNYILKHSCSAGLLLPLKAKYSVPARLLNSERASIDLDIFGPNVLNDIHVVSAMAIYR